MWGALFDWVKGLFGGKGGMQIGKVNKSITATITESSGMSVVGDNNVVNYHATPVDKPVEYALSPAEVEILSRLAKSSTGNLHCSPAEGNILVVIDGECLNSPYDTKASTRLKQAIERSLARKLLSQNGENLSLTAVGEDVAAQVCKQLKSQRDELLEWFRKNGHIEPVSHVLHHLQQMAKVVGNKEVEHWCQLELIGYTSEGGMTEDDEVPEYRGVSGVYFDRNGQAIRFPSDLDFANSVRLRLGVSMLEEWSKKTEMQNISEAGTFDLIQKHFNIEVVRFTFSPLMLVQVVNAIRNHALRKVADIERS